MTRWAGPCIVALVGVIMMIWTWGKWPDPVIDFGREIYVPWRLSQGEVLYRDIVSYFNGPLSPYTHALLFKLFGPSLRLLVIFNLILIALLGVMLYRLMASMGGELAAIAGGVVFFVLFAFAQLVPTGNYNFVCPYSYELTHGIMLTVAALCCMQKWLRGARDAWLVVAAGIIGLVALTKAEVFLAGAVALLVGIGVATLSQRDSLRDWGRSAIGYIALLVLPTLSRILLGRYAYLAVGAAIVGWIVAAVVAPNPVTRKSLRLGLAVFGALVAPALIALLLLSLHMHVRDALNGMMGAWRWVGVSELIELPYFKRLSGTEDPYGSASTILHWSFFYAFAFAPGAVAAYFLCRPRMIAVVSVALLLITTVGGLLVWTRIDWNNVVRPAPVVLLVVVAVLSARIMRRDTRLVLQLVFVSWALALLAKMPLNAHIYHYGFALAMPATLVIVVLLMGWIPRVLERAGGTGWPLRATAAGVLVVVLIVHLRAMDLFFGSKTSAVGRDADRFYADSRGAAVNVLLEQLARTTPPKDTLVMIPEGLLVNYLSRRVNPTGQLNFTPPAVVMYGQGPLLRAFQERPPDWIVILDIDTSEYGARSFGQDYAQQLIAWIQANYQSIETPNLMPGLRMLRRIR